MVKKGNGGPDERTKNVPEKNKSRNKHDNIDNMNNRNEPK